MRKKNLDDHELEPAEQRLGALLVGLRLHRVLADDVDRGQVASLHGVEHARQVPAALGRHGHAPLLVERCSQGVVFDVLEARQAVGQGAHVATTLDVVLATQRVQATAVAPHVPRQERQRDEREHVVDGVVVLGDAQRPADHGAVGGGEGVCQLTDGIRRHARLALPFGQGPRLDAGSIGLEVGGGAFDEGVVGEAGGDNLATNGVGQRDVRTDVKPQPQVGPFGRAGAPWVDHDEPRPAVDGAQHVVEEDGMRLPGIAAPEDDQVRLLDLTI